MRYWILISLLCFCYTGFSQQSNHDFTRADSVAKLYPKHSLANLELLSGLLTNSLINDIEKYRSIFMWVCWNIDNDYYLYEENFHKRKRLQEKPEKLELWLRNYRKRVFKRLNETHKTMCTGYAYLIDELCHYAGIECEIVNGYGKTVNSNLTDQSQPNHSWNAVNLDGKWMLSDATWSSGFIKSDDKQFVRLDGESYFLVDPALFWLNHYPVNNKWLLLDVLPDFEDFQNAPLIYRKALELQILPLIHLFLR